MKRALWILGVVLLTDLLYVSYFHVWRASYYFPDRYEEAFAADVRALLVGLPVMGAFVALLIVAWHQRRSRNGVEEKKEPIQPPQTTTGSSAPDRV